MATHNIGIIGFGKIAQDQHLPAIKGNPAFDLLAVASKRGLKPDEAKHTFQDYREMLRALPDLEAVSICTPPQVRHQIARDALLAGKSVLLEKPPAATLSELEDLKAIAKRTGVTLFATWHAQYNHAVDEARAILAGHKVKRLVVNWKEDVRHWHPGQQWIWQAGGFGIFDPGINALSILTRILPEPIFIQQAKLQFPSNRDAPIAADLVFSSGDAGEDLQAHFDWRQTGPQTWDIEIETADGKHLDLAEGGIRLAIDGKAIVEEPSEEYEGIYARFARLLDSKQSDVEDTPFRLVADAFMVGQRVTVEPFMD
ncbi:Gfo/Idh/MocA family protein [Microvirga sp. 2MCAF38]|uniref:Gfo/Idh/MocA family protein n=1 Tax=Microvirga sp. 2MCAF38 TaxID=3232989 RepID=UPI003F994476